MRRFVTASAVSAREPVGVSTSFRRAGTERIFAFLELEQVAPVSQKVRVVWIDPDGRERGGVDLEVAAQRRWRTWAFTRHAAKAGRWSVRATLPDGVVLAQATFDVAP